MTFGSWIIPISIYSPVEAILPNINFLPCLGPFFVILLKWVWGRKERSHLFLWHSTPSLITSLLPTPPPRDIRASVNKYHFVLSVNPILCTICSKFLSIILLFSSVPFHSPSPSSLSPRHCQDQTEVLLSPPFMKLGLAQVVSPTGFVQHMDTSFGRQVSHKLHLFPCADVIGPPECTGKQTFTPTHESSIRKTGTLNSVSGGSYKIRGAIWQCDDEKMPLELQLVGRPYVFTYPP